MYTCILSHSATYLPHCLLLQISTYSLHLVLMGCVTPCIPYSRYGENLSYWLTFGVPTVIQLLMLYATGQIPVWVSSQWHKGHFSCWVVLSGTVNISLCELHKHKYHGISSHIWCYFISINNCDAKALKWRLNEDQIFCQLIHATVFFHVSRKEQMKGINFCQTSFSAGKGHIWWGIFFLLTEKHWWPSEKTGRGLKH